MQNFAKRSLITLALLSLIAKGDPASALCDHKNAEIHKFSEFYLPNDAPAGCTFLYRKPIDANISEKHYQYSHIRKRDFVCFGHEIIIDKPIYSNGGNVLIFARDLNLSAPIDTRIYTNLAQFDALEDGGGHVQGPRDKHFLSKDWVMCDGPSEGQEALSSSFQRYYQEGPDNTILSNDKLNLLVPRMPDGLLPSNVSFSTSGEYIESRDGKDAPVVNQDGKQISQVLKSGNITVYAANLSKDLHPGLEYDSSVSCRAHLAEPQYPFLMNANGLTGGRGGPGATARCIHGHPTGSKFSVNCYLHKRHWESTGFRGTDSLGGAPGEISIFEGAAFRSTLNFTPNQTYYSAVEGGTAFRTDGGKALAFNTPRPAGYAPENIPHKATGSICDFFPPAADESKAKLRTILGQSIADTSLFEGPTQIQSFGHEEFAEFLLKVINLDNQRLSDYDFYLRYPELRSEPGYLLFQDAVSSKLLEIVRVSELGILDAMEGFFLSGDSVKSGDVLPFYLNDLDIRSISESVTSERLKRSLRLMRPHQLPPGTSIVDGVGRPGGMNALVLRNYFYNVRGALFDMKSDWEIIERLKRIQEIGVGNSVDLRDIKQTVQSIQQQMDDEEFESIKLDILSDVSSMEMAISEIRAEIEANNELSSTENWMKNAAKVVESAAKFVGSVSSAYATGVNPATAGAIGKSAIDLDDSFKKLENDAGAFLENFNLVDKIRVLRREISSLNRRLHVLTTDYETRLNRIANARISEVDDNLRLELALDARVKEMTAAVVGANRAVLLDYLMPATRDDERLRQNLQSIRDLLNSDPAMVNPTFNLGSLPDAVCVAADVPGCISVPGDDNETRLFLSVKTLDGASDVNLPMYIFPSLEQEIYIQSYGLAVE